MINPLKPLPPAYAFPPGRRVRADSGKVGLVIEHTGPWMVRVAAIDGVDLLPTWGMRSVE